MTTCADIIARARKTLGDKTTLNGVAVTPRDSDADLLGYLNDGLAAAYALRPDLLYPSLTAFAALALGATFPLAIQHEAVLADYIVFRASTKDDEHVLSGRAEEMRALFERGILST